MISSSQNTGGLSGATSYEHMEQALSQVSSHPAHEQTDSSETHSQQLSPKEGLATSHESEGTTAFNDLHLNVKENLKKSDSLGGSSHTQDREKPNHGQDVKGDEASPHLTQRTIPSSSHTHSSGTEMSENDEAQGPTPSLTSRTSGLPQTITLLKEDPNPAPTALDGSKVRLGI